MTESMNELRNRCKNKIKSKSNTNDTVSAGTSIIWHRRRRSLESGQQLMRDQMSFLLRNSSDACNNSRHRTVGPLVNWFGWNHEAGEPAAEYSKPNQSGSESSSGSSSEDMIRHHHHQQQVRSEGYHAHGDQEALLGTSAAKESVKWKIWKHVIPSEDQVRHRSSSEKKRKKKKRKRRRNKSDDDDDDDDSDIELDPEQKMKLIFVLIVLPIMLLVMWGQHKYRNSGSSDSGHQFGGDLSTLDQLRAFGAMGGALGGAMGNHHLDAHDPMTNEEDHDEIEPDAEDYGRQIEPIWRRKASQQKKDMQRMAGLASTDENNDYDNDNNDGKSMNINLAKSREEPEEKDWIANRADDEDEQSEVVSDEKYKVFSNPLDNPPIESLSDFNVETETIASTSNDRILLIWSDRRLRPLEGATIFEYFKCAQPKCIFTHDRRMNRTAAAIVFDYEVFQNLATVVPNRKGRKQIWILLSQKPPLPLPNDRFLEKIQFDWTWSYRTDATVRLSQPELTRIEADTASAQKSDHQLLTNLMNQKRDRLLVVSIDHCWSHNIELDHGLWEKSNSDDAMTATMKWARMHHQQSPASIKSWSEEYVDLMNHIVGHLADVQVLTRCPMNEQQWRQIFRRFAFVLLLQKVHCNGYRSPLVFWALEEQTTPILTDAADYEQLVKMNAAVALQQFKDAQQFAQFVLHSNTQLQVHRWQSTHRVSRIRSDLCAVCQKVHENTRQRPSLQKKEQTANQDGASSEPRISLASWLESNDCVQIKVNNWVKPIGSI